MIPTFYRWFDTNGAVTSTFEYVWSNQNTVNWSLAQGGTETLTDGWACFWSPQGPPNSGSTSSRTSLLWPPAPGLGTYTNISSSGNWAYDSALSSYNYVSTYATNAAADLAQPSYPWVHVAVNSTLADPGDPNNPAIRMAWTNAVTETAQARLELLTGGEPGATNVLFHTLWVYAWNNGGGGINQEDIVVAGQNAEPGNRVVLALAANTTTDITPSLPASYTNYTFWIGYAYAWTYAVYAVTPDDGAPSVGSTVTFTAVMNDTGPTPPVIQWLVNGVPNTNSTDTTFTCAFTNAGTYIVTARCGGTEASTTVTVTFRGTLTLTAGALDIAVGSPVTFTASTTPTVTPDFATWSGPQSYRITPPATNEAWFPNLNGGFTKTFYFDYPDYGSDSSGQPVTLSCGDRSTNQYLRVYAVQAVTASTNIVAVTSNAQFTAILTRSGPSPPPIQWYVNGTLATNSTGTNLDYTFTNVGPCTVEAWLGSSKQSNTVTVAFAGEINLAVSGEDIALGDLVDFTATPTPSIIPTDISWTGPVTVQILPLGQGQFPDNAAGLLSCTVRYDSPGEKVVSIKCDNSTTNKTIRVYEVASLTASESLVAVGSNVNFTATRNLVGGNPPPLVWTVNGTLITNANGLSFSTAFSNVGINTVIAQCGTSKQTNVVNSVGVKRVEYENPDQPGTWATNSGTLHIYKGDIVTFRAIPDPTNSAWPSGWPQWSRGGTTAGAGESKSFGFNSVSASPTNYQTITARCGTSSNPMNTITFNTDLVMVPDDSFAGRSSNQFGFCELIHFTNNLVPSGLSPITAGVLWDQSDPQLLKLRRDAGDLVAHLEDVYFTGGYWIALTKGARQLARQDFEFVAPSTADYVPLTANFTYTNAVGRVYPFGPNVWHETNRVSAGRHLWIYLKPSTVSFYKLLFHEGVAAYQAFGSAAPGQMHDLQTWSVSRGEPNMGSRIVTPDTSSPALSLGLNLPIPPGGSTSSLPLGYSATGTNSWLGIQWFDAVSYREEYDADGKMTVTKGTNTWFAPFSAPTSSYTNSP